MATKLFSFAKLVVLAVTAAVLVECSAAASYIVGDTLGWLDPTTNTTVYSIWASQHTFVVGDTLVFNYASGQHNVARVSKEAYDACNTTNTLSIESTPPTTVTLNDTGNFYFFCTIAQHCSQGQKLAINVTTASPPASPPTSPSPTPTPSPPPSSPAPASSPTPTTSPPPSPTSAPPPGSSPPPSPTTAPPPGSSPPPPPTTAPPPGSSPSPTSPPPPPPPPSSASPKAVAAFAVVLMSIAIGVMC